MSDVLDPEIELKYRDFWSKVVENEDGSLNVNQVKRELVDYMAFMEQASRVYYHVTNGLISKCNTCASSVIMEADRVRESDIETAIDINIDESNNDRML